jgi:hypothetical protein
MLVQDGLYYHKNAFVLGHGGSCQFFTFKYYQLFTFPRDLAPHRNTFPHILGGRFGMFTAPGEQQASIFGFAIEGLQAMRFRGGNRLEKYDQSWIQMDTADTVK